MKKSLLYIICISAVFACNKPEAVFFKDNSSVMRADKTGWVASADSETPDGWENTGKPSATIDGDINTYWHTDYSVVVPYPHWLQIDMKKELNIVSVDLTNRQAASPNTVGMKRFKLEGSKDGTSFTSLGEFNFAISNAAQSFPVSSAVPYRFIKITALEPQRAGTNHTFLAEVDVYVTKN